MPYIEKRDEIAIKTAQASASRGDIRGQSVDAQSEALRVSRKNVILASEVIKLGGELKQKKSNYDHDDPQTLESLQSSESELKASRQRWRVLKGTTSGVITGSGVDWGRDARLRELVLDTEGDD